MATSYIVGAVSPFGCKVGDRISLVRMGGDPCPVEPGSKGTVIGFCDSPGMEQIVVNWDNGRGLNLIPGIDRFRLED